MDLSTKPYRDTAKGCLRLPANFTFINCILNDFTIISEFCAQETALFNTHIHSPVDFCAVIVCLIW